MAKNVRKRNRNSTETSKDGDKVFLYYYYIVGLHRIFVGFKLLLCAYIRVRMICTGTVSSSSSSFYFVFIPILLLKCSVHFQGGRFRKGFERIRRMKVEARKIIFIYNDIALQLKQIVFFFFASSYFPCCSVHNEVRRVDFQKKKDTEEHSYFYRFYFSFHFR